jgi:hypothetical protein
MYFNQGSSLLALLHQDWRMMGRGDDIPFSTAPATSGPRFHPNHLVPYPAPSHYKQFTKNTLIFSRRWILMPVSGVAFPAVTILPIWNRHQLVLERNRY